MPFRVLCCQNGVMHRSVMRKHSLWPMFPPAMFSLPACIYASACCQEPHQANIVDLTHAIFQGIRMSSYRPVPRQTNTTTGSPDKRTSRRYAIRHTRIVDTLLHCEPVCTDAQIWRFLHAHNRGAIERVCCAYHKPSAASNDCEARQEFVALHDLRLLHVPRSAAGY